MYIKNLSTFKKKSLSFFAFETALIDLYENIFQKELLFYETGIKKFSTVNVNALLHEESENLDIEISKLLKQGYKSIKIKVGRSNLEDDIDKLVKVFNLIPPQIKIRLDANRLWDIDASIKFANFFRPNYKQIEYIEEPVKDHKKLPYFFQQTQMPYALDETLFNKNIEQIKNIDLTGVEALILKPILLGSVFNTLSIIVMYIKNAWEKWLKNTKEISRE